MQQKSFDLPRDAKYARASLFPLKKKPGYIICINLEDYS